MAKLGSLLIRIIQIKLKLLALLSPRSAAHFAFQLFCTPQNRQVPKIKILKYPILIVDLIFRDLKIKGYIWNRGALKKVLIVHGFSSSALKFQHFVEPLALRGFEVFAFDAPAHGSSEGKSTNAVQYAEMLQEVITTFGPFNHYIAHSFGGLAIMLAMEKKPQDDRNRIVLIAPATETSSAINSAFELLLIINKNVRKEFNQIIFATGGKPAEWFSINRALHNIEARILWIHDEEDDVTPIDDAENAISSHLAKVKFIKTHGLGHRKIYHEIRIIEQVVLFLSD